MEGKIFADSANLAQDKAKVLFQYFKKAAEKIVSEETELEKKVAVCQEELATLAKNKSQIIIRNAVIGGIGLLAFFLLIFGLILIIIPLVLILIGGLSFLIQTNSNKKLTAEKNTQIATFQDLHKNIRRDYKVTKLAVAYVPIASKIPFEGKSFLIDHTGTIAEKNFSLSAIRSPSELNSAITELQTMAQNIPLVETANSVENINTAEYSKSIQDVPMYDYMGNLDRQIRNISYRLRDVDRIAVSLPIILPNSPEAQFIASYTASDTGQAPIINVFQINAADEKIKSFSDLNAMKNNNAGRAGEYGDFFRQLMKNLAQSAQLLTQVKMNTSSKVLNHANGIFSDILKASFNHYSPVLEAEEIARIRAASFDYQDEVDDYKPFQLKASSRVKYDLFSGNWVAEDGSRTSMPFGLHQIQEEIIMPVIQNLMEETRIERLKIYNKIKDQKIEYLNQWHRDTEDFYGRNRAESNDLINRMREALAEYMSSFNTFKALQETENQMSSQGTLASAKVNAEDKSVEAVAAFELQANNFRKQQDEFVEFMDRLKEEIDRRAAEFGHIEFYEASLRDDESKKIAQSTEKLHDLDARRRSLLAAGAHFAAFAKMPPAPNMDEKLYTDLAINLEKEAQNALAELEAIAQELHKNNEHNVNIVPDNKEQDTEKKIADDATESVDNESDGKQNQGE